MVGGNKGAGSCWRVRGKRIIDKIKKAYVPLMLTCKAGGDHRRHRARLGLRLGSSRSRRGKAGGGGLSCTYLGDFLDVSDRFEPQLNFAQGSRVSGILRRCAERD